jgi:hypothetical protein
VVNPDLFWALRGGGAGTFGIVTQATVKVFPSPRVTVSSWWINTTSTADMDAIYEPAAYLHSQLPSLSAKGVQGYYFVYPHALQGIFLTAGQSSTKITSKDIWSPVLQNMGTFDRMRPAIQEYAEYPSFKIFFDAVAGPRETLEADDKCSRELQWTEDDFDCEYNNLMRRSLLQGLPGMGWRSYASAPHPKNVEDPVCIYAKSIFRASS